MAMKTLRKSAEWLQTQAKTLETKTLKRAGRSLTFSGIADKLTRGAVLVLWTQENTGKTKQWLLNGLKMNIPIKALEDK